jgi:selenophosphate synthetase-related protein
VVLNDPTPTMKLLLCNSCTGALIFFTSVPCSERVVVKQWLSSGSVQFLM